MTKNARKPRARWKGTIVIILITVLALIYQPITANAEKGKMGDVIRVGFFPLTGFHMYDDHKNPIGYDVEYLNKIAEKTGWKYEYVPSDSWQSALKQLDEGKIDLLAPSQFTIERQEKYAYSTYSIGTEYGALLTLKKNKTLIYEDFNAFSDISVGCVPDLVFKDDFMQYAKYNGFMVKIKDYKNTADLIKGLREGEVDGIVANIMTMTDDMRVIGKFGPDPIYYIYNKENTEFGEKLDNAISTIKVELPNFENELIGKYFPSFSVMPFNKKELEYIKDADTFVVGCPTNKDPISYINNKTGEIDGISREIIEYVGQISGLKFKYVPLPKDGITYEYLKHENIDFISCTEYNTISKKAYGTILSNPYLTSQKVIVGRRGEKFNSEKELNVALIGGPNVSNYAVITQYPNFKVSLYDSAKECMDAVLNGKADILMQNQYVADVILSEPIYESLEIIPVKSITDKMCLSEIVYRQGAQMTDQQFSDPRLMAIINKSIARISPDEIQTIIIRQTIDRPYNFSISDLMYKYRFLLVAIMFIATIAALAFWYVLNLRRRNNAIIRNSEQKLKSITDNINGGVVVLLPDEGMKITYANEGFLDLIGCTQVDYEKVRSNKYIAYVHGDDRETLNSVIDIAYRKDEQVSIKLRILGKGNKYIPALFNGTFGVNSQGEKEMYCVIVDISQQEKMMELLQVEQERYKLIMEKSDSIMFDIDMETCHVNVSKNFKEKFGWVLPETISPKECETGISTWKILEEDREGFFNSTETLMKQGKDCEYIVRIVKSDDTWIWCKVSQYLMKGTNGEKVAVIGTVEDIDYEMREKELLKQKSELDNLTGLYNKAAFAQKAQEYIGENPDKNSAILFMDLDNFKSINDVFGHMAGDEAIKDAASKLQRIFANCDIISRFGGDEFCVLVKNISVPVLINKLHWVIKKMQHEYKGGGNTVKVTASLGVAYVPTDGLEIEKLLERADNALYHAKQQGKNSFALYKRDMEKDEYVGRSL